MVYSRCVPCGCAGFPAPFIGETLLCPLCPLGSLVAMGSPCMFELGSWLSILLHGSVCLFLGPDYAVSVPSASSSMWKSESVIRPALFVFLRIPWPIQGLLLLARNFRIVSSISLANMAATLTGIAWNPEIPFSAMDVSSV